MKIALVYDRVNKFGGAERVLQALHKIWPEAPLFTAVWNPKTASWSKIFQITPSFLQKLPFLKNNHEVFPFLMPFAFESFDFSGFDVVLSITSAEAKGIITKPSTLHICYCLTPTRYLWSGRKYYQENMQFGLLNPLAKLVAQPLLARLKKWDQVACFRPDYYLAISRQVQARIKKYYQQDSEVIYPGIDLDRFKLAQKQIDRDYFLVVSRLVSYKRVDLVIKAFNQLGWPLKIIGSGKEKSKLKALAKDNITFIDQNLTDQTLLGYYQNCLALVFAGQEDLGLVALEAQACGRPVICLAKGGMPETVKEGKTGLLFKKQTSKSLLVALKKFDKNRFKDKDCVNNASKFSQQEFIKNFKRKVEELWHIHQKSLI